MRHFQKMRKESEEQNVVHSVTDRVFLGGVENSGDECSTPNTTARKKTGNMDIESVFGFFGLCHVCVTHGTRLHVV